MHQCCQHQYLSSTCLINSGILDPKLIDYNFKTKYSHLITFFHLCNTITIFNIDLEITVILDVKNYSPIKLNYTWPILFVRSKIIISVFRKFIFNISFIIPFITVNHQEMMSTIFTLTIDTCKPLKFHRVTYSTYIIIEVIKICGRVSFI